MKKSQTWTMLLAASVNKVSNTPADARTPTNTVQLATLQRTALREAAVAVATAAKKATRPLSVTSRLTWTTCSAETARRWDISAANVQSPETVCTHY